MGLYSQCLPLTKLRKKILVFPNSIFIYKIIYFEINNYIAVSIYQARTYRQKNELYNTHHPRPRCRS